MDNYMLTTIDNPYSPFSQYDEWFAWDWDRYNSLSLLARVTHTSPNLSDEDQHMAIQQAIKDIVTENVSGMHTRVKKDSTLTQAR